MAVLLAAQGNAFLFLDLTLGVLVFRLACRISLFERGRWAASFEVGAGRALASRESVLNASAVAEEKSACRKNERETENADNLNDG